MLNMCHGNEDIRFRARLIAVIWACIIEITFVTSFYQSRVACPFPTRSGGGTSSTTTIVKYIRGIPGLGIVQRPNEKIKMMPSNASDLRITIQKHLH